MASKITNNGKTEILKHVFQGTNPVGSDSSVFNLTLLSGTVPTNPEDLDTQNDVSSNVIAGKTVALTRNTTDFDQPLKDASANTGRVQIKDCAFSGAISGATGAILTDDNGTANSRVIYAYFDLGGSKSVDAGQTLTLQNLEMKLSDS